MSLAAQPVGALARERLCASACARALVASLCSVSACARALVALFCSVSACARALVASCCSVSACARALVASCCSASACARAFVRERLSRYLIIRRGGVEALRGNACHVFGSPVFAKKRSSSARRRVTLQPRAPNLNVEASQRKCTRQCEKNAHFCLAALALPATLI